MYALCPKHRVSIRINFLGTNRCDRSSAHLSFSLVSASRGVINDLPHLYTIAHRPRNIERAREAEKGEGERKKKKKDIRPAEHLRRTPTCSSSIIYELLLRALRVFSTSCKLSPTKRRSIRISGPAADDTNWARYRSGGMTLTRVARLNRLFVICCHAQLSPGNNKTGEGEEGRGEGRRGTSDRLENDAKSRVLSDRSIGKKVRR